MVIPIEIEISQKEYRARALDSEFSLSGPSVCITAMFNGKPLFMSIAEGEEAFKDDPDFLRMKALGELRIFNPCDIQCFEPENAAVVVFFLVNRAQRHLRKGYPSLVREFFELFVDRFVATIHLAGFDSLSLDAQNGFRSALRKLPGLKRFQIIA